jgi:hypothetical protein
MCMFNNDVIKYMRTLLAPDSLTRPSFMEHFVSQNRLIKVIFFHLIIYSINTYKLSNQGPSFVWPPSLIMIPSLIWPLTSGVCKQERHISCIQKMKLFWADFKRKCLINRPWEFIECVTSSLIISFELKCQNINIFLALSDLFNSFMCSQSCNAQ